MVPYKRWLAPSRRMMKEISSSSFLFLFIFRSQYFHHYLCSWTNHYSLLGVKWCILGDPGAVSEARESWNGRKNRRSLTLSSPIPTFPRPTICSWVSEDGNDGHLMEKWKFARKKKFTEKNTNFLKYKQSQRTRSANFLRCFVIMKESWIISSQSCTRNPCLHTHNSEIDCKECSSLNVYKIVWIIFRSCLSQHQLSKMKLFCNCNTIVWIPCATLDVKTLDKLWTSFVL